MPKTFAELEVAPEVRKAIDRLGFEEAAPAQAALLPLVRAGRSVVLAAPPVSGRTLALALAAVETADDGATKQVRTVILCATRERVLEVSEAVRTLATGRKGVRSAVLFAGRSPLRDTTVLESGAALLIGTPGCVRHAVETSGVSLAELQALFLDRADELLDAGFGPDVSALLARATASRQIVAVTTFISPAVEELAGRFCPDASRLVLDPAGPAPALTWHDIEPGTGLAALTQLTDRHDLQRAAVFANTSAAALELAAQLTAAGYPAEALVSGLSAAAREKVLKKFRLGAPGFLVMTDAAARDLAAEPVEAVVHVGWPLDDAAFATRHAWQRAGGIAFALVSGRDRLRARALTRRGTPVRSGRLPTLGELAEGRQQAGLVQLREALASRNPAACRTLVDTLIAEGYEPAVIAGAAIRLLPMPAPMAQPALISSAPAFAPAPEPSRSRSRDRNRDRGRGRGRDQERFEPVPRPEPVESAGEAPAAADEQAVVEDWSPGVSDASAAGEYADAPAVEGGENGENPSYAPAPDGGAAGTEGGYSTDSGYIITDNVSEDGVVYPPGANFGDEETPTGAGYGGGNSQGGRGGRRERGGRSRGAGGGGGGGARSAENAPTAGMHRLWLNVGRMDRVQPKDIVGCILGETGLPSASVGRVQLFERHTLVDVSGSFESQVLEALNRTAIRGRKLRARASEY